MFRHASTNLHNLSHGRVGTLLESAFVVDAGPIYVWLPGLVCLLGLAELLWGSVGWWWPSSSGTWARPYSSRSA